MTTTARIDELSPPELWALARTVELHAGLEREVPDWGITLFLEGHPLRLGESGACEVRDRLVSGGLVTVTSQGSWSSWKPAALTDEEIEALVARLAAAFPLPDALEPADWAMLDAMCVAGAECELDSDGFRCLFEPPFELGDEEFGRRFERLIELGLVLHTLERPIEGARTTYAAASPLVWVHGRRIAEAMASLSGELRPRLLDGIVRKLELPADSRLAAALAAVDRARFVDERARHRAVLNGPLPVPGGSTSTSSPTVCALMVKALAPARGDRVLLCGVKGGYTAALLAETVGREGRVTCLEWNPQVAATARESLVSAGLGDRVEVRTVDDVTAGLEEEGPWNGAIINGSIPKIPYELIAQLRDGGKLLFFLQGPGMEGQNCYLVTRNEDVAEHEDLAGFSFTPVPGARYGWDDIDRMRDGYRAIRDERARRTHADEIERKTVYPLCRAYLWALNTGEMQERHTRILKAFEALVRTLAMPGLALLDLAPGEPGRESEFLARLLERASFGHWLAALREVPAALAARPEPHPWVRLLRDDLARAWREEDLVRAGNALREAVTGQRSERQSFTLLEFLELVVTYRNRSPEGHGTAASRRELEARIPLLQDSLGTILVKARCLQGLELVHVEDVSVTRSGEQVSVLRLAGSSPRRIADWKLPAPVAGGLKLVRDSVLLVPSGGAPPVDLHPWAVFGEGQRGVDLFLFDSDGGYVTFHDANRYPPSTLDEFDRLKSKHAPRRETLSAALSALLDLMIEDGAIDPSEMDRLVKVVLREGVRGDEAAARAFIAEEARRRQPGVVLPDGC